MDSVQFCVTVCHEVMQPEFASYTRPDRTRVLRACGVTWGPAPRGSCGQADGAAQVYAVAFNTHSRPIPSPVDNLRPARDTCEQCHWPEQFHGDRIRAVREYGDDAANTESVTVMRIQSAADGSTISQGCELCHKQEDLATLLIAARPGTFGK